MNHRPMSQKCLHAQTLVIAVPTRLPLPPSASITPHLSSYSHSQHNIQYQQPQPHPMYPQAQTSSPCSAQGTPSSIIALSHTSSFSSSLLPHHHNHNHISEGLWQPEIQGPPGTARVITPGLLSARTPMPPHLLPWIKV
jgi:hypothetical protein